MVAVPRWTGKEARALREALRMSVRSYASYLGVGVRTVAAWDAAGDGIVPRPEMQAALDTALAKADDSVRDRFRLLVASDGPSLVESSVDGAAVDGLLRHYLTKEAQVGGDRLVELVADQVTRMAAVVEESPSAGVLSAYAQLCQMAGWLALDANQHSSARVYFGTAVLAAHQADEPALAANVLAYMSLQETYRDHRDRALALARTAQDVACGGATPYLRTVLATRLARAYARTGVRSEALAAMAAAEAAFEGGGGEDSVEPLWLSFVDLSELHAQKGACYLDLGMPREAEVALLEALRALRRDNPSHARDRAHYLSRLAKCHLLGGDLEQACAAGHQALDGAATIASARVMERIAEFHVSLAPHAGNGDVRTFRDRFSGHLRSQ